MTYKETLDSKQLVNKRHLILSPTISSQHQYDIKTVLNPTFHMKLSEDIFSQNIDEIINDLNALLNFIIPKSNDIIIKNDIFSLLMQLLDRNNENIIKMALQCIEEILLKSHEVSHVLNMEHLVEKLEFFFLHSDSLIILQPVNNIIFTIILSSEFTNLKAIIIKSRIPSELNKIFQDFLKDYDENDICQEQIEIDFQKKIYIILQSLSKENQTQLDMLIETTLYILKNKIYIFYDEALNYLISLTSEHFPLLFISGTLSFILSLLQLNRDNLENDIDEFLSTDSNNNFYADAQKIKAYSLISSALTYEPRGSKEEMIAETSMLNNFSEQISFSNIMQCFYTIYSLTNEKVCPTSSEESEQDFLLINNSEKGEEDEFIENDEQCTNQELSALIDIASNKIVNEKIISPDFVLDQSFLHLAFQILSESTIELKVSFAFFITLIIQYGSTEQLNFMLFHEASLFEVLFDVIKCDDSNLIYHSLKAIKKIVLSNDVHSFIQNNEDLFLNIIPRFLEEIIEGETYSQKAEIILSNYPISLNK